MSTFGGLIEEIPGISIDRFDGLNVSSSAYFLSHIHYDHTIGLRELQYSLDERPGVYLYASPITVQLLRGSFPYLSDKLRELPLESPSWIKFYSNDSNNKTSDDDSSAETSIDLHVTVLSAGHCPGSVMFLFETTDGKNILYTGDYCVSGNDLKKYKAFYDYDNKLKIIDAIYIDTTFCDPNYRILPIRKESSYEVCKLVKEWVTQSDKNIVHIVLSAYHGSEYLFMEIAQTVGMPIHVCFKTFNFYKYVPELDNCVTIDSKRTRIHAGCGLRLKEMCYTPDRSHLRKIIPSVLYWKGEHFKNGIVRKMEGEVYRVCYSCHSSLDEIEQFLLFLKPKKVKANVEPSNNRDRNIMESLLKKVMACYQEEEQNVESNELSIPLFDLNFVPDTVQEDVDDSLNDLLDSPDRCCKSLNVHNKRKRSLIESPQSSQE